MKKTPLFAALLLLMTVFDLTYSHGQQSTWYIPPYHYNMNTATPTPSGTTTNNSYASQSVNDNNGSLLFYIENLAVYKSNGIYAVDLPSFKTANYDLNIPYPKMIIVPVPTTCNKYYVIYPMYSTALGATATFYVILDVSSGTPTIDPSSVHPASQDGAPSSGVNPTLLCGGGTFAVSKTINSSNERYLFGWNNNNYGIFKYRIGAAAITQQTQIASFPSGNYYPPTIELSPNQQYLAWCPGSVGDRKLYQIELNPNYDAPQLPLSVDLGYRPRGIQYDATSSYIFVSGGPAGISWHTSTSINTGAFTAVTGASSYGSSSLELGKTGNIYAIGSGYALGYLSTASMPSPTITATNITVNSSYTDNNPSITGYGLPGQIDGENYTYFSGIQQPISNFNVNGTPSGNVPPQFLDVFTCANITLNNTSTGFTQYYLGIQSCDANGNPISGTGYLNYVSGYRPTIPTINLKALPLPVGTNTWLADPSHIGYYKITFAGMNSCSAFSVAKTMYLKLNAPPSAATINLKVNNSMTGVPCYSQTIGTACPTGIYSASYNIGAPGTTFASNNISSYSRKIEEVNCSTGGILSTLYEDASPVVPPNPSGTATGLALNAINIGGSTGYFATHPVMGKCYKLTITAYNPCSNAADWTYLTFDGAYRPGQDQTNINTIDNSKYAVTAFPNPVQNTLNIMFTIPEPGDARIEICDIQGKLLIRDNEFTALKGANKRAVNISSLAKGIYLYKLYIGSEMTIGRISRL